MRRTLLIAVCGFLIVSVASVLAARILIARGARNKTYVNVDELPYRRVGLVLGCPKRIPGGWLNPYFENRIAAAAELYQRGKIEYLVVSGDNHVPGYDEPTDMKNALLEKGVPLVRRIEADGLDSAMRGQENGALIVEVLRNNGDARLSKNLFNAHHGIECPETGVIQVDAISHLNQ